MNGSFMRSSLFLVLFAVTLLSACAFVPQPNASSDLSIRYAEDYDSEWVFVIVEGTNLDEPVYVRVFDETMNEELTREFAPMNLSNEDEQSSSSFVVLKGDATVPRTIRLCTADGVDVPSEGDTCTSHDLDGLVGSLSIEGPTSFAYAKSEPEQLPSAEREVISIVNDGTATARVCVDLPSSRYSGPLEELIEYEAGAPEWDFGTISRNGADTGYSPCMVLRPDASATFELYPLVSFDVEPSAYEATAYVRAGFADAFPQSVEDANILEPVALRIDVSE